MGSERSGLQTGKDEGLMLLCYAAAWGSRHLATRRSHFYVCACVCSCLCACGRFGQRLRTMFFFNRLSQSSSYRHDKWNQHHLQIRLCALHIYPLTFFFPHSVSAGRVSLVRITALRLEGLQLDDQGWYECRILLLDKPTDELRNGTWTVLSVTGMVLVWLCLLVWFAYSLIRPLYINCIYKLFLFFTQFNTIVFVKIQLLFWLNIWVKIHLYIKVLNLKTWNKNKSGLDRHDSTKVCPVNQSVCLLKGLKVMTVLLVSLSVSSDLNSIGHLWKKLKHLVWWRKLSNLRQLEQFAHKQWSQSICGPTPWKLHSCLIAVILGQICQNINLKVPLFLSRPLL